MKELNDLEKNAREEVLRIAKDNGMYFVVWSQHFGRKLVALENNSHIKPTVYHAIYEAFHDIVGKNDNEVFSSDIPDSVSWIDLLSIIKSIFV